MTDADVGSDVLRGGRTVENDRYMRYLLEFFLQDTFELMDNVLDDDERDPQFSAITVIKRFWAYIQCEKQIDEAFPYRSVAEFLRGRSCRTEEDIALLFRKARAEYPHYHGEIDDAALMPDGVET